MLIIIIFHLSRLQQVQVPIPLPLLQITHLPDHSTLNKTHPLHFKSMRVQLISRRHKQQLIVKVDYKLPSGTNHQISHGADKCLDFMIRLQSISPILISQTTLVMFQEKLIYNAQNYADWEPILYSNRIICAYPLTNKPARDHSFINNSHL